MSQRNHASYDSVAKVTPQGTERNMARGEAAQEDPRGVNRSIAQQPAHQPEPDSVTTSEKGPNATAADR